MRRDSHSWSPPIKTVPPSPWHKTVSYALCLLAYRTCSTRLSLIGVIVHRRPPAAGRKSESRHSAHGENGRYGVKNSLLLCARRTERLAVMEIIGSDRRLR